MHELQWNATNRLLPDTADTEQTPPVPTLFVAVHLSLVCLAVPVVLVSPVCAPALPAFAVVGAPASEPVSVPHFVVSGRVDASAGPWQDRNT